MPTDSPRPWTLLVHGGAGILTRETVSADTDTAARAGLDAALAAGEAVLAAGCAAIDAVEAAVRVLEDDPTFNSGRGAVFTFDGTIELDAAIMDGRDRSAGAVAGVTGSRHPVTLARAVKDHSPHVLLSGKGADIFAAEQGVEAADADWFMTPERRTQLDAMKADPDGWFDVDMKYGTVGAVAVDAAGHVAAATSTGGVTGKRWGRIGDSPLIGAGTYADDRACAMSATGSGEFFIRMGVGHEIAARIRFAGESIRTAADTVLAETKAMGGTGGVIVVGPDGDATWSLTTPGMFRGRVVQGGARQVAIYGDEG
ncbi:MULTISPECIES: isoaspartyl peptidase/L-asparaginase family protein [unclassified Sphingomonas]|uniref:isoaspartyl peptidase/L-asparaginase family protein n=1 Tax=unclassified Sphingomonas TaxID=196159 RepID=UPI0006F76707|nr:MULTISPECIES: isoaspartyl peptidase/L-asparaginase [unclassified Sphingomonas]KQM61322.1 asparaginase [Sphingomonas sp. Leaf16]KQN12417.1 asparaginase [Sphingomonas sp. Leaf29]KQN18898.1 asparaginase [Sphingomonas sp. Leaf32]